MKRKVIGIDFSSSQSSIPMMNIGENVAPKIIRVERISCGTPEEQVWHYHELKRNTGRKVKPSPRGRPRQRLGRAEEIREEDRPVQGERQAAWT